MDYETRRFNSHSQSFPIIPILSRNNLISRTDTYFFKVYFNIAPYLRLELPKDIFPVGLTNSMAQETRRFNIALYIFIQRKYIDIAPENTTFSKYIISYCALVSIVLLKHKFKKKYTQCNHLFDIISSLHRMAFAQFCSGTSEQIPL